jgi:hypothetical protein
MDTKEAQLLGSHSNLQAAKLEQGEPNLLKSLSYKHRNSSNAEVDLAWRTFNHTRKQHPLQDCVIW